MTKKSGCTWCNGPVTHFKDDRSKAEYKISGYCQSCQDKTFVCEFCGKTLEGNSFRCPDASIKTPEGFKICQAEFETVSDIRAEGRFGDE